MAVCGGNAADAVPDGHGGVMNLRHRITIQSKGVTQDPATGYEAVGWVDRLVDEPAAWLAGPGREYLASEAVRTSTQGRFSVRWSPEAAAMVAGDRVLWDGRTMALVAPALTDQTGRRELTLMVMEAGTDGA